VTTDKENIPPLEKPKAARLYGGTPQSVDRLIKPFKCPGSATPTRTSERAPRKRRKVSYVDADASIEEGDKPYSNEERLALATRDANKYPVFKVKDKDAIFRSRFAVPLLNKDSDGYNSFRPPRLLGMRNGAVFVAKALHDPSGEFAIVLYDPTIDDENVIPASEEKMSEGRPEEESTVKVDAPLVHKSLAEILGIKKNVEERPKVPVVIDPRLAKVLRPHQVEGVKVNFADFYFCTELIGTVSLPVYYRPHGYECKRLHYGRRNGLGEDGNSRQQCKGIHYLFLQQLQCITLMWTLLKQSPEAGKPTIQKCVIACPSSLVRNWANELGTFIACFIIGVINTRSEMAWKRCCKPICRRW